MLLREAKYKRTVLALFGQTPMDADSIWSVLPKKTFRKKSHLASYIEGMTTGARAAVLVCGKNDPVQYALSRFGRREAARFKREFEATGDLTTDVGADGDTGDE